MSVSSPAPEEARDLIHFPEGLLGLPRWNHYRILESEGLRPLRLLQAADPPNIAFPVLDPVIFVPEYTVPIDEDLSRRLGGRAGEPLLVLALVNVPTEGEATANLRAPLIIHPQTMVGIQHIFDSSQWPLAFPCLTAGRKNAAAPCSS